MTQVDFNHTIDIWIRELDKYATDQLYAKPSPGGWSIGQVYQHCINETGHFLRQADICLSNNENQLREMSANAKKMFAQNAFPDEIIEGPPSNADTQQPEGREQITRDLQKLRDWVNSLIPSIANSSFSGKTRHPGLQYFNASEWLQFADMHMRHHFRQKERIDGFLGI